MKIRAITLGLTAMMTLGACQSESDATAVTQPQAPTFTLEEAITEDIFKLANVPATRWLADGSGYTTLESNENGGEDIVRYHPVTQERTVLVSASQITPEGQEEALEIADYQWSQDGSKVIIFTNTVRSWRTHTLGDYWVLDLTTNNLKQLGEFAEESTLQFAKFNPQGNQVAYVQANNLYVESLASNGGVQQLTFDGSDTIINGTFDWVNEEEFGLRDGFRWSPSGDAIAYWQVDTSGVESFTMIDNTSDNYPQLTTFPYPKVGETNSSLRVGVIPADGGETTWMNLPGDPRAHYIVRMEWAGNNNKLMLQQMNRAQNTMHFWLGDRESGDVEQLITEQSNAWVEQVDDVRFFRNGQSFTWQSERSGFRHLYRYDADAEGDKLTQLTRGNFDVVQLLEIVANEQGEGKAYYIASPQNHLERYLFSVDLSGESDPVRLTPEEWDGTHGYQIAQNGEFAIHSFSEVGVATQTNLVALPSHEIIQVIEDNSAVQEVIDERITSTTEFFQVEARDGLVLDGFIMKPRNFDPTQSYPLIMYVYGEPWGQTVANKWLGNRWLWHEYMTQQGYVVASIDNRGTKSPRGREWRHSIYKQLGIVTVRDQADALQAMLERWSWLDGERVGIWGHSGGGSQTLNALFRYPELFHAGIASAPVPDLRLYDTIYQERYSGLLPESAEQYEATSAITHAANLEGELLLIHGTGDDNVHYQGSEALINELIRHQKQFEFMAYPNRSHSIREGEGTVLHYLQLKTDFFLENLPVSGAP
ncbi:MULTISPECIES: S9 family peptidase [Gammaproteobacteria]|uniref:S9 family peptidase n=1 Tax=Gammaproteobacteria TaxID=1236 RepID=UPI000DD02562|nr:MULTISPECIES: S9 family peptidase [Gammaproteobacteria]RTE85723.1 S9 family peptidase [Aliidiomarina sp. B3213]TCZ90275.1 S9 family peptidase [Lysobacter sp. N42]